MSGTDDAVTTGAGKEDLHLVLKEARDLAKALEGTATNRLRVELGWVTIEIERGGGAAAGGGAMMVPMTMPQQAPAATGASGDAGASAAGGLPIVAPLVGVFYSSGTPGAKPFVEVGATVERGQVVGIIEAMKVMNEVTSDYRGTVTELLVQNGDAVQYEQVLMRIDPAGAGG